MITQTKNVLKLSWRKYHLIDICFKTISFNPTLQTIFFSNHRIFLRSDIRYQKCFKIRYGTRIFRRCTYDWIRFCIDK